MTPRDRKLALGTAVEKLGAIRDPHDATRWAYYADETESWWSVSEASLLRFVEVLDAHGGNKAAAYDAWAEDDSGAIERGRRL